MERAVDLFVMGGQPRALPAVVVARDGDHVKMRVDGVSAGAAVCFQGEGAGPWVHGRVTGFEGDGVVVVQILGRPRADRRGFARAWGPVHVRYQLVDAEGFELAGRRWLRSGRGIERAWIQPELFMNFSGSGLRFGGGADALAGQRMLLGVRVPHDPREHRLTAEVIRSQSGEGTALRFLEASEGAVLALVDFAERIQQQDVESLGS